MTQRQRRDSVKLKSVVNRRSTRKTGPEVRYARYTGRKIAVYDAMRAHLEQEYFGKWVVFHDREFVGSYDEFEDAAEVAITRFGRGPYLIRQVGIRAVVRIPYVELD